MSFDSLLTFARSEYPKHFASSVPATHYGFAPGRTNLIGEHTDYNDGFVFPMAIQYGTIVVGNKKSEGTTCSLYSIEMKEKLELDISKKPLTLEGKNSWKNYVIGVIALFCEKTGFGAGFEAVIASNVPIGGGLSSSAALLVGMMSFLEEISGISLELKEKALLCQRAEREYAGLPCGIMDQFCSAMGVKDHAILIDCRSQEAKAVPLDSSKVHILVINSNVHHELSSSEYPLRVAQCQGSLKAVQSTSNPSATALRDVTLEQLEAAKEKMSDVEYRRAKHNITENERTLAAVNALQSHNYVEFGLLMRQSHESLKTDYEVSCGELDTIVETASKIDGVFGCRMTGGGFGGCCVALVDPAKEQDIATAISQEYKKQVGKDCTCIFAVPGAGCFGGAMQQQ